MDMIDDETEAAVKRTGSLSTAIYMLRKPFLGLGRTHGSILHRTHPRM
jgi:hypothetical protein